jgi:ethanolamine utilization protein EutQ
VIDGEISRHMGGGIEYLENASIDWTVTYDWAARQGTVEP